MSDLSEALKGFIPSDDEIKRLIIIAYCNQIADWILAKGKAGADTAAMITLLKETAQAITGREYESEIAFIPQKTIDTTVKEVCDQLDLMNDHILENPRISNSALMRSIRIAKEKLETLTKGKK